MVFSKLKKARGKELSFFSEFLLLTYNWEIKHYKILCRLKRVFLLQHIVLYFWECLLNLIKMTSNVTIICCQIKECTWVVVTVCTLNVARPLSLYERITLIRLRVLESAPGITHTLSVNQSFDFDVNKTEITNKNALATTLDKKSLTWCSILCLLQGFIIIIIF